MAAAETLTGKRFGLLVASSVVATSAIVASAMTGAGDSGALAALLGRQLASHNTPAATTPAPVPPVSGAGPSAPSPGGSTSSTGGPLASPAPPPASEAGGPVSEPATPSTPNTPAAPAPEAGPIKHVFVISLASPGYEAAFGTSSQMPYLSATLRPQGQLLSGYSLIDDAGLANDIAAVSGQPPNASTQANCATYAEFPAGASPDSKGIIAESGCVYPVEALTIADQLGSARLTWRAYLEGMADEVGQPDNCVHPEPDATDQPAPGGYAARRNPFVYFHSLLDLGDCAVNDQPLTELEADLRKADSTASYTFISPNPCNAGVSDQCAEGAASGAAAADSFLSQWVPKILAAPAYKRDGLLIVSFDQIEPAEPVDPATAPTAQASSRQVGALLISPYASPGATDASPYDPYSLLRSIEDLFGLSHLGRANGAKVESFAPGLAEKVGSGD
jgi:phosphatidylinositol-3-phosphatase